MPLLPPGHCALPFPEDLREVTVTEFKRTLGTASHPFEALGRDPTGSDVHMCVKPILHSRPDSVLHVMSELVAAGAAAALGVPVPEPLLVRIPDAFLAAAGSALADVSKGWTFGNVWVEQALPAAGGMIAPPSIRNPESVAGVTVLDTLMENGDRHGGNILLQPEPNEPGHFRLWYIDNAYAFNQGAAGANRPLTIRVPQADALRALVTSQDMFMPYLVQAEGLSVAPFETLARRALTDLQWALPGDYAAMLTSHFRLAGEQIREVVMNGLASFPNCS